VIRVCLVDDQTLVRQGIRSLLELADDIEVVAEARDGREAVDVIHAARPDVVLLDVRMPVMSGCEVMRRLSATGYLPPTLILTTFDDDAVVFEGLREGAKGYLLKDVSLEQLVTAIRTVAEGRTMFQPAVTERVARALERSTAGGRPGGPLLDPLTEREVEILRLLAGGYSNREIADALRIAEGTVKNHVSNILSKLDTRDRTRAVLKAIEHGLI
jgi:DNA-binding NarL/FixJ family response regulator